MSFVRTFRRTRVAAIHCVGVLVAGLGASFLSLAGCFSAADGLAPPDKQFYYPTALAVSPGQTALYVINSDFDLQYSGGTVQALDLVALRQTTGALRDALNANALADDPVGIDKVCGGQTPALSKNDNSALYPGPCSPVEASTFITNSVEIGAFASSAAVVVQADPCDEKKGGRAARLFIPVRGDPSVTYIDVTDDREIVCNAAPLPPSSPCGDDPTAARSCLSCGSETNAGRCSSSHLIGVDPSQSARELTLDVDPYGVDVDELGEALVVVHQTQQTASLIVNDFNEDISAKTGPKLQYATASLSPGPTDTASLPIPRLIRENNRQYGADSPNWIDYTPAFVVSYRSSPEFTILRYEDDFGANTPRPFLTRGLSSGVSTTASSTDSRGVAVDGSERAACEDKCGMNDREVCLRACAENHPLGVYMANRAPAALVIGRIDTVFAEASDGQGGVKVTGAYEIPSFHDSVPLAFGASRVEVGHVVDEQGRLARRIFAVTFDSRFVFSYNPEERRVDAIIRTGRGPHAVVFDSGLEKGTDGQMHAHSTMYVAHFTDSYVGVVDLDMRNRATFGSIYMTLGKPVPPKGSQ